MRFPLVSRDRPARRPPCAVFALAVLVCALAQAPGECGAPKEKQPAEPEAGPLRALFWVRERRLPPALLAYPHPIDPGLVYVTTERQLARSRDAGRTWESLKASGLRCSDVTVMALCPADTSLIYAGTRSGGVFRSTNGGNTFARLGGTGKGLVNPSIFDIKFWPSDPTWRTLVASHGKAAPGLSLTEDAGKSWRALATREVFRRFVITGRNTLVAEMARSSHPDSWSLAYSYDCGAHWSVVKHDVSPMAGAIAVNWPREVFWATVDEGILRGIDRSTTISSCGPRGGFSWVNVLSTWGSTARQDVLCAYDPNTEGLVRSTDRLKTWTRDNQGLHVGRFIKDGANVAVNANGSAYFASVNNVLYVGRPVPPKGGPRLVRLWCNPPAASGNAAAYRDAQQKLRKPRRGEKPRPAQEIAAAQKVVDAASLHLRAQIEHPGGVSAITEVRVYTGPLGDAKGAVLLDDGKHGDGKAGDGMYGITLPFSNRWFSVRPGKRAPTTFPGRSALTVKVTDAKGEARTAPLVVGIYRLPTPFTMWAARSTWWKPSLEGPITIARPKKKGKDPKYPGFVITSKEPKAWSVKFIRGSQWNTYGQKHVVLEMKGSVSPSDMFLSLYDNLEYLDDVRPSREVGLVSGGYVKAITPEFQSIRVPVEVLCRGTTFRRGHCGGFRIRVPDGVPPGTWQIDSVSFTP